VTFGSFNTLSKLTPRVVAAWAEIVGQVPGSRLLLKAKQLNDPEVRWRCAARFAAAGLAAERLELCGPLSAEAAHLGLYGQIDVALDPFPYNGTTTTCEALWMGVPVVTLAGDRHAGRVGASLLAHLGLYELVAPDQAGYVERAVALANEPARLAALRRDLRGRLRTSPLCDPAGFARAVEAAYRAMWRRWCAGVVGAA
jgi:predicted O-linked N-acetylglucosamine transferase (SPINDLY family)